MTSSPLAAGDAAGSMPDAATAVVAGHGDFAAGIISAVAHITGCDDRLAAVSNRGLAPDEIERLIAVALDRLGARAVFTDLPAGSCTVAARRLQRARPELVVVTGASLPAVLDFVLHAPSDEPSAASVALAHAVERGRAALAVAAPPAAAAVTAAPLGAPTATGASGAR